MKTRNHNWLDSNTLKTLYGIMVFVGGSWKHATKNGVPLLFDTEEARDRARDDLRKVKTND